MTDQATAPTSAPAGELAVRGFSTGRVRGKRATAGPRRYLPGGWSDTTLPVYVYVVEHPAGVCLFDAGQTARAAEPGYFPWWYPFFRLARFELGIEDEAQVQLRRLGYDAADIRWVALSHLHTDHAGGMAAFAGSEALVSRPEWELATDMRARLKTRGYLPQYWPDGLEPTLVDFGGPPIGPFAGSFDIAGDGHLVLVPTPGHTRGHMSLLVRQETRGYLLSGDLAESVGDLAREAPDIDHFCRQEGFAVLTTHDRSPPLNPVPMSGPPPSGQSL